MTSCSIRHSERAPADGGLDETIVHMVVSIALAFHRRIEDYAFNGACYGLAGIGRRRCHRLWCNNRLLCSNLWSRLVCIGVRWLAGGVLSLYDHLLQFSATAGRRCCRLPAFLRGGAAVSVFLSRYGEVASCA